MRYELYYAIMNIVDYLALATEIDKYDEGQLYKVLDKLLAIDTHDSGITIDEEFEGIADANDVGGVKTWQEMVTEIKKLHETGERI